MINTFLISAILIFIYMSCVFIIAQFKNDNSLADVAWGPGFLLLALFWFFKNDTFLARQIITTSFIAIWAIRLGARMFLRNRAKGEDPRYTKMKEKWKTNIILKSFLYVFMLQGALILVIASPIIFINTSKTDGLYFFDIIGILFWLFGFYFEAAADYQLDTFLRNPENRGKIMKKDLWRFSRHPNYFGESLMWWGFFFIALNVPYGFFSIVSPVTITYLLLFVSGIPMTEKMLEGNPEFEEYKKKTSPFIPWLPKN